MSYDIHNAAAQRSRELRVSDASQFDTLRLVVQRSGSPLLTCSLIVERIGRHRIAGSRLAFATLNDLDIEHGEHYHQHLLLAAVTRLR